MPSDDKLLLGWDILQESSGSPEPSVGSVRKVCAQIPKRYQANRRAQRLASWVWRPPCGVGLFEGRGGGVEKFVPSLEGSLGKANFVSEMSQYFAGMSWAPGCDQKVVQRKDVLNFRPLKSYSRSNPLRALNCDSTPVSISIPCLNMFTDDLAL